MDLEILLQDQTIYRSIKNEVSYEFLGENRDATWAMLASCGYLSVLDEGMFGERVRYRSSKCYLEITNYSVKQLFFNMIKNWFCNVEEEFHAFVEALFQKNVESMNVHMNQIALRVYRDFDTGTRPWREEPERFYHGLLLGILVNYQNQYEIVVDSEKGFRRYDVILHPKNSGLDIIIMELDEKMGFSFSEPGDNAILYVNNRELISWDFV